ncbi:MAG: tetratricopeptide repeat protein [Steroidobacteraceae bacterium]
MRNYIMNANNKAVRQGVARWVIGAVLLGTVTVMSGSPAFAADDKKAPKVSKDLAKTLKEAQDLETAKKYSDALAKLKEADANPKKIPYDQHVINELEASAYIKQNNYAEASKALEASVNDGFLTEKEQAAHIKAIAQINYQLKNWDKAIEYGNRAIKGGFADDEMKTLVGQTYYLKGDYKGTLKFYDGLIDSQIKAGQTPKDEAMQLALSACIKLNDNDCTTHELERLVEYHPKTEYWQQLLYSLRSTKGLSDRSTLQVYRLMSEVDVLKEATDYTEMAQLAIEQGNPGEAQHVLEKGFQKNVFADPRSKDKNTRLLESAKKAAQTDLATLPKVEKDADAASTGDKNVGVGLAYLGYQQYDKATDQLNKGLTKGSVRNEAEAHLLLGIAQLKSGKKDEAVKQFKAVKGDPNLERLAELWSLRAKQA